MSRNRLRTLVLVATGGLLVSVAPVGVSQAAGAPPPVSNIRVTLKTDHRLGITWDVPAVYYSPGVVGVVRITRGYTPAATPTGGYWVGVSNRTAETASCSPNLTPDAVYTFAVWVEDHGSYSARRSISVRTLKDTTAPPPIDYGVHLQSSTGVDGDPQVIVTWQAQCDALAGVRIVRNTKPTLTGGTVLWSPGSTHAFLDHGIAVLDRPYSAQRLYYWVIPRDPQGRFADHYTTESFVFADRTITGHVGGTKDVDVMLFCCPNDIDASADYLGGTLVSPTVNNGDFTLHAPSGSYTVCVANHVAKNDADSNLRCWAGGNGSYSAQPWYGGSEFVPGPNINLVTQLTFGGIQF